jgi:hypothetical protein
MIEFCTSSVSSHTSYAKFVSYSHRRHIFICKKMQIILHMEFHTICFRLQCNRICVDMFMTYLHIKLQWFIR